MRIFFSRHIYQDSPIRTLGSGFYEILMTGVKRSDV